MTLTPQCAARPHDDHASERHRRPLRLDAARRIAAGRHGRLHRHVVVRRRAAGDPGGIRRAARLGLRPLRRNHARLRSRRRRDGTAVRPLRHFPARRLQRAGFGSRLCRCGLCAGSLAVHDCAGPADRILRQLRCIRSVDGRHLALVRPPPRHRHRHLLVRQLSRRRDLAADHPILFLDRRLAHDAYRHRHRLRRDHAAAGLADAAPCSGPGVDRCRFTGRPRRLDGLLGAARCKCCC